jgi:hypothetical protein
MQFAYDDSKAISSRREHDLVNIKQLKLKVIKITQKLPAHRSDAELKLLVEYFLHFNVFKHIYLYSDLYRLAQHTEYRYCPFNHLLFRQGEKPDGFYILVKGELAGGHQKSNVITNFYFDDMDVLLKLKSGSGFGELAILENKRRAITMRAIRDSHLFFLSKQIYIDLACPSLFKSINANIEFLKPLQVFGNFTDEKLREFCVAAFEKQYSIGYTFNQQGSLPEHVVFIKSGLVEGFRDIHLKDLSTATIDRNQQAVRGMKFPVRIKVATLGCLIRKFAVHKPLRNTRPTNQPLFVQSIHAIKNHRDRSRRLQEKKLRAILHRHEARAPRHSQRRRAIRATHPIKKMVPIQTRHAHKSPERKIPQSKKHRLGFQPKASHPSSNSTSDLSFRKRADHAQHAIGQQSRQHFHQRER